MCPLSLIPVDSLHSLRYIALKSCTVGVHIQETKKTEKLLLNVVHQSSPKFQCWFFMFVCLFFVIIFVSQCAPVYSSNHLALGTSMLNIPGCKWSLCQILETVI